MRATPHRLLLPGIGLPLLLALAVGCSNPSAGTPAPGATAEPGASPQTAAKPKVDRVVFGVQPPSVEGNYPITELTPNHSFQYRPMYEFLVGVDENNGKLIPQLATEWNVEPDGSSYRIKLRKGVQFHKGQGEFSAKDAVFFFDEVRKPTSQAPNQFAGISTIDVVNDYEMVVHLKQPDSDFINIASEVPAIGVMMSKAQFEKQGVPNLNTEPLAGTGAYQFVSRDKGAYMRFQKVPYKHWRADPAFPEFEYRWMREASTRLAALVTGEIHITTLPQDLRRSATQRGMKSITGKVPSLRVFARLFCCYYKDPNNPSAGPLFPDSPLSDVRVRKAMSKAINRDEMNKALFGGEAEIMINDHFRPQWPGWNPEWERKFQEAHGYDTNRAKALLAEAGYGPNKPLKTNIIIAPNWVADVPEADDVAEGLANYWRAIGIDITMVPQDLAAVTPRQRALGYDNHIIVQGTGSYQLFALGIFNAMSFTVRGGVVEDLEVDRYWKAIKETLDPQKQEQLWRQLGDATFEKYQDYPLFWLPAVAVVNPQFVADYQFPGVVTSTWSHQFNIKPAA